MTKKPYLALAKANFLKLIKREFDSISSQDLLEVEDLVEACISQSDFLVIPLKKVCKVIKNKRFSTKTWYWYACIVNENGKFMNQLLKASDLGCLVSFRSVVPNCYWFDFSENVNPDLVFDNHKKLFNILRNFCTDESEICFDYMLDQDTIENVYLSSGYDRFGYNHMGYNSRGFNKIDIHLNGTFYDDTGFNRDGVHLNGTFYDDTGFSISGFNRDGVHLNGTLYDDIGFSTNGFNKNGIHKNGTPYDDAGYDVDEINSEGYGLFGYDYNDHMLVYLFDTGELESMHGLFEEDYNFIY